MRFFLAGIMQGSHAESRLHNQDYRAHIARLIEAHFPQAEIYDPRAKHTKSLGYSDGAGRSVFMRHNLMCREVERPAGLRPRGVDGHGHRDVGGLSARGRGNHH